MVRRFSALISGRAWIGSLLLWIAGALLLAAIAGQDRFGWSQNDHFVHLARDLHQGRWTHDAPPPGYCSAQARRGKTCRYHQFDDWARAQELILDPSLAKTLETKERVWAISCRTLACRKDPDLQAHRWWIPGRGLRDLAPEHYRKGDRRWFVSFPPGPAIWFLLPLWLGLPPLPDTPLTWLLAATVPVTLDLAIRGRWPTLPKPWSIGLALGSLFASAMVGIAVQGQVWFLAQISFAALLSAGLACWFQGGRRLAWLASLCWGLALTCRPSTSLGVLAAVGVLAMRTPGPATGSSPGISARRWSQALMRLFKPLAGPLLCLGAMATWNWHRFGSVLEFGHHFLEIRWLTRIQSHGMFDTSYLAKNITSFLFLPPRDVSPLTLSIHGIGWIWSTPWLVWLSFRRGNDWALLACVALGVAPALFYQNTGQLQTSYRFAVDLLPLWSLAIAPALSQQRRRFVVLGGYALLLHVVLAWAWVHHPELIFGSRPSAWPFS